MIKHFKTPLDGALYMAAKGFKVFPLVKALTFNDPKAKAAKRPLIKGYQDAATCDEKTIRRWGEANPLSGFGVLCVGLSVIDDDSPNGRDGITDLESKFGPLPDTFTVKTWSGRSHHYFSGETKNDSSKARLPLIDIKTGRGGLVICPGTVIHGRGWEDIRGIYSVEKDLPIAELPGPLFDFLKESGKEKKPYEAPEIVEEGGRNDALIRMLGKLRHMGLTAQEMEALVPAFMEERFEESLPDEEVARTIESVCTYAPGDPQALNPFSDFSGATADEHSAWGSDIDLESLKPTDWIIRGRYVPGYLTVTGAPAGVGKSRVVMLEAIAVATGASICGHEVRQQGPVWYISEDPLPDMQERFAGVCKANNIDHKKVPILLTSLMDLPLRLIQKEGGKYLIDEKRVQWMEDEIALGGIKLLILDPWKRFSNCEENDNSAADALCAVLQRIASRGKCAVGIVHHTGKAASKGDNIRGQMDAIRGASALAGAARVIWTIDHYRPGPDQGWNVPKDDERLWVRMDPAKCNLAPLRPSATLWYHLTSVRMAHHVHPEDSVGVAKLETPERAHAVESMQDKADAIKKAMEGGRMALKSLTQKLLEGAGWTAWAEDEAKPNITTLGRMVATDVKGLSGFDGFPYALETEKVSDKYTRVWVVMPESVAGGEWD